MADAAEMAQSIVDSWDDDEDAARLPVDEPATEPPEPEEEVTAVEAPEPEPEEEEAEDEDEGDDEGEEEEGEQEAPLGFDTDDPDVQAYLAQYQGDPLKALRAAAELRRAFGRQGNDLAAIRQQNEELQRSIVEARALSGGARPLSGEQSEWAEAAALSGNPGSYVQQAMQAGEFDLARAVCREWAREDPFEANRVGQFVDSVEYQSRQAQQAPLQASTPDILEALWANVPGMKEWEPQMVSVFENLGEHHHLVQESRSNDPDVAMRALINIFEIAKASTASVQERKSEIKRKAREEADGARSKAAVSSSSNSPKATQTPRDKQIMPGLTMEDLDTEFARS